MKRYIASIACLAILGLRVNTWAHEGHHHENGNTQAVLPAPENVALPLTGALLHRPEYLHILLNPIPIYGTGIGMMLLLVGLVRLSPEWRQAGLVVILVSCAAAWPVVEMGEKAYDRLYPVESGESKKWLETHHNRGHQAEPVFYVTAALALAALISARAKPTWTKALSWAVLLASVLCLRAGAWVARAGGQISHPEFRTGPPLIPRQKT